jgi:hypothetical protein
MKDGIQSKKKINASASKKTPGHRQKYEPSVNFSGNFTHHTTLRHANLLRRNPEH